MQSLGKQANIGTSAPGFTYKDASSPLPLSLLPEPVDFDFSGPDQQTPRSNGFGEREGMGEAGGGRPS